MYMVQTRNIYFYHHHYLNIKSVFKLMVARMLDPLPSNSPRFSSSLPHLERPKARRRPVKGAI